MKHCFKIFENSIKFEKKKITKFEKSAKSQKPKTIFFVNLKNKQKL